MSSETNWICDWCGAREEKSDRFPKEWAQLDPQQAVARSGMGDRIDRSVQRNEVRLFPKEMCVEQTEEHERNWEGELCGDCLKAILDALKNVREVRISKRPKK